MGMATPQYGYCTADGGYHIHPRYRAVPVPIEIEISNAQAPQLYLDKNIEIIATHKKQKRGKFKRRG